MALELDFSITYANDVSKIYINDTTGVYSASNTTGWGAPNTERNTVALFTYIEYHPYTGTVYNLSAAATAPEVVLDYSATTNKQFNVDYYKDGWYTVLLVALPVYSDVDAVSSVTVNNIYYSTTTSTLKYFNGVAVKDITLQTEWDTLKTSAYTKKQVEVIPLLKLTEQYNCLLDDYQEALSTNKDHTVIESNLIQLASLIQATTYRFYSDKQLEAQKMTENLTKQFKCCN